MATVTNAGIATPGDAIVALVALDGTGASPHAQALRRPTAPLRDLADAVHAFCALHGTAPGMIELTTGTLAAAALRDWSADAARWFAAERAALATLTAAVGPLPSTPGQAESRAVIAAQRHALMTLAQSDRTGCAIGAALAFVLDWEGIQRVLLSAADRAGCALAAPPLPATDAPLRLLAPGHTRAMMFGAQQLVAQHRGLWQLLEARASARDER